MEVTAVGVIAIWGFIALASAVIAALLATYKERNYSAWAFWSLLFPPALWLLLFLPTLLSVRKGPVRATTMMRIEDHRGSHLRTRPLLAIRSKRDYTFRACAHEACCF